MFLLAYAILVMVILFLLSYLLWRIRFKPKLGEGIRILAYHRISDGFDWGINRQRITQFEKGIRFLRDQGYITISLEEAFTPKGTAGGRLPENLDRKVVVTFDDGYEDVYLNAFPILLEYGFTASVFVITGFVGKCNSWDYGMGKKGKKHLRWEQIEEMSKWGIGFGSHTVNHPDLTRIDQRFVGYELKESKEVLEERLGKEVNFLSYPFGRYNRFVQEEAKRMGYKRAYTLCSKDEGNGLQPYAQSRWGIYLFDSSLTLRIKLNHGRLLWIEDLKGRIVNRFASGTAILKGSPDYSMFK